MYFNLKEKDSRFLYNNLYNNVHKRKIKDGQ